MCSNVCQNGGARSFMLLPKVNKWSDLNTGVFLNCQAEVRFLKEIPLHCIREERSSCSAVVIEKSEKGEDVSRGLPIISIC